MRKTVKILAASNILAALALVGCEASDDAVPAVEVQPGVALTAGQENALRSAQRYVDVLPFSKAGLYWQLVSEFGGGYRAKDARFAVQNVVANWNEEAVEAAESYLDVQGWSRSGLIKQLTNEYGGQFTYLQAVYAVDAVGL